MYVLVTLAVVDWEGMGPFYVLNSAALTRSLESVAWKLKHRGSLPSVLSDWLSSSLLCFLVSLS